MSKQEKMVTRRVLGSKVYNVYEFDEKTLQATLLETIETKGKVSEKELAEKHKVEKVVVQLVKENKEVYGMPVDEFMKYAVKIKKEDSEETK
jgi:hypothetical protein